MKYEHLHDLHYLIFQARKFMEDNMTDICAEIALYDNDGSDPKEYLNDIENWKSELEELESGLFEIIEND